MSKIHHTQLLAPFMARLNEREALSKILKGLGFPILKQDGEKRLGSKMKMIHKNLL